MGRLSILSCLRSHRAACFPFPSFFHSSLPFFLPFFFTHSPSFLSFFCFSSVFSLCFPFCLCFFFTFLHLFFFTLFFTVFPFPPPLCFSFFSAARPPRVAECKPDQKQLYCQIQKQLLVSASVDEPPLTDLLFGPPTASPLFGHRCTVGVLAGTHRCDDSSRQDDESPERQPLSAALD